MHQVRLQNLHTLNSTPPSLDLSCPSHRARCAAVALWSSLTPPSPLPTPSPFPKAQRPPSRWCLCSRGALSGQRWTTSSRFTFTRSPLPDYNEERGLLTHLRARPAAGTPPASAEPNCLGSEAERYFHLRIPRTFPSVGRTRNTNYGCSLPSG